MSIHAGVIATLDVEGQAFHLLQYTLHEALFEVPSFHCEAHNDSERTPSPSDSIGKQAEVTLARTDGSQSRSFCGIVVAAERSTSRDDVQTLSLTIAPRLWRATKRSDCRIFRAKSVPDIVKEVFDGAGIADQEWKLTGEHPPRDHTAQYRETDLEFARRLLSEEGIYFFVKMADGKDTVVLGDNPAGLGPIEGKDTLPFVQQIGAQEAVDVVYQLDQALQVRPDKVFLRDYDPAKPRVMVEGKAEGTDDGPHALEVYRYPGRFTDKGVAERHAKVLLQSMQCERDIVTGETGVLTLLPGHRFSVEEHPYAPLNREYLVTRVDYHGSERRHGAAQTGEKDAHTYRCRFTAIPTGKSPYQPPRLPRERTLPGAQTAITTGPPGQEIHTDKSGQVTAYFHWDRRDKKDESSSCWMRTSQLSANGSVLLPRTGWEVSVRCNEGDIDRPFVMARVYNATSPPPYSLPGGKARAALQTNTSPGDGSSNEFRTDDTKGKEEMFFNASKDMSVDVKNNTTESVANNQTRKVGANHKLEVTNSVTANVGANQSVQVGGNQTMHVQTFAVDEVAGSHSLSVGGDRSMKVGGDHKREVAGSSTLTINGMSIDLVVGSVSESTLGNHNHTVGAALVELTASKKSVLVGGTRSETAGAAKVIVSKAGRAMEVGGALQQQVGGAIITKIGGDRNDSAGGTYTEVAAGAQIIKAGSITFEADAMLSCVMGASTITLLPAVIAVAGVSVKLNGDAGETAAMIIEN